MIALKFHGPQDSKIEHVPTPQIPNDGVLVEVHTCGICTTDVELYDGSHAFIRQGITEYPFIPGHEWSGIVKEVGSSVKNFQIGDWVVGDVSIHCGSCKFCMRGDYHLCENRKEVGVVDHQGAFAQYLYVPEKNLYQLPDKITLEEAALVEPLATALHGLERVRVKAGDFVVVIGDGSIGILAAQCAKAMGASRVVILARKDFYRDLIQSLGLEFAINSDEGISRMLMPPLPVPLLT